MKVTYFIPAHPSYFSDGFTQAEIDLAIQQLDERHNGLLTKGDPTQKVPIEVCLLREPGKSVCIVVDSSGVGGGRPKTDQEKKRDLAQFQRTSNEDLEIILKNLIQRLARNKREKQKGN